MNHVMLDIDGTLIQSYEFDEKCFVDAVYEITGLELSSDWGSYPYVTDRGILKTFIERQAPQYSLEELEDLVKPVFIRNIQRTINSEPAKEVPGAREFVSYLMNSDKHVVSIATGGWSETAKLKLESAGFELEGLTIASSNDHYSRIKIMEVAKSQTDSTQNLPVTYFGDAAWDVKACEELGVNLVIVGERVNHQQRIVDFSSLEQVLRFVK
ncbi:TPA: HAD family hydrolase [Vibrio parahaemolyticus]|nr:HAD family hydrolase [Vibrio parahaemolyticus]HCE3035043.1 HAD family hydrolase [Vibrio parahaemolyticus]HCG7349995.1 HAD family hydrolase [Vibrio parahaemolyticus]HCG7990741.1 HAD family hydrolase [Vibrio parahaemolyticus]HCH1531933.1 HAD family hydrolase [Vibrio parahaemolyticus]